MPDSSSRDREGAGETALDGSKTALPQRAKTVQNEPSAHSDDTPAAYLITFTCYGSWVRGDKRGSVDRRHNQLGTPVLSPDANRVRGDQKRLKEPRYELGEARRNIVLKAIQEVCEHRRWPLLAVHVRVSHLHVIVAARDAPERIMNDFKAYSSRALNRGGLESRDQKRWTRHGSTRKLWKEADVAAALHYVVHDQGEPMAVFYDPAAVLRIESELEKGGRA
jgi:REP element-mobilizing transposase RayT